MAAANGNKKRGGESVFMAQYDCRTVVTEAVNSVGMVFSQEIIASVGNVMKSQIRNKKRAEEIRTMMEDKGLISLDATHQDITSNVVLQRLLKTHLAEALPKEKATSVFFPKYVSDFDLYFNGSTDAKCNALMTQNGCKSAADMLAAQQASKKMQAFVTRVRNNMVDDMDFPGTPDRASHKKLKTEAEVQAQMTADAATLKAANDASNAKKEGDNDEDEDDEEEDEEELTATEQSSSSSSSSKKTLTKKVVNAVIECFPELEEGYYLELVDSMLQLVVKDE